MLREPRRWVMPGPDHAGIVTFYEDFPYAWWSGFRRLDQLPVDLMGAVPADVAIAPEYADIGDQLERKITGIRLYESQVPRLFGNDKRMADAVRTHARQIADLGRVDGFAERYWASARV
jgi:hypothetical protein